MCLYACVCNFLFLSYNNIYNISGTDVGSELQDVSLILFYFFVY